MAHDKIKFNLESLMNDFAEVAKKNREIAVSHLLDCLLNASTHIDIVDMKWGL